MKSSARDTRLARVDREVLKRYRFSRSEADGVVKVEVVGGQLPYTVSVHSAWAVGPSCTCPDAARPEVAGYCKHTLAVLSRESDLAYQLLEVYL